MGSLLRCHTLTFVMKETVIFVLCGILLVLLKVVIFAYFVNYFYSSTYICKLGIGLIAKPFRDSDLKNFKCPHVHTEDIVFKTLKFVLSPYLED